MPSAIVFVTRKYPPQVGGMETLAANTHRALVESGVPTGLIALRHPNRNLVWWLPLAALRLLCVAFRSRRTHVLFGDALTWATLSWIPRLFRLPSSTMIMGLDVTYSNPLYRAVVYPALRRAPHVLAISAATRAHALERVGLAANQVSVIVLGIPPEEEPPYTRAEARRRILDRVGAAPDAVLLLTTGRLVRRKGVLWFVREVLPRLPKDVLYLVAGSGDDRDAIERAASELGLTERVRLLGRVSDEVRTELLHGADVYVQPNIPVPDDVEGFGLVVTEASQAGLFTVAADLEGLIDAVRDGETGVRVPSRDADAWNRVLASVISDPERAEQAARFQAAARRGYSLQAMADRLFEIIGIEAHR